MTFSDTADIVEAALPLLPAMMKIEDTGQIYADLQTLWTVYKTGKLDVVGMRKAGTLKPAIDAMARFAVLLGKLEDDPAQQPRVEALLARVPVLSFA